MFLMRSTNKNCKAGDIEKAELYPKEDVKRPLFSTTLSHTICITSYRFYMKSYPGSVIDVSQLQYMSIQKIRDLVIKNGICFRPGYFSKENLAYMDSCNYGFVIMVKGRASFVKNQILSHKGEFETKRACAITQYRTYGMTVREKLYTDYIIYIDISTCITNPVKRMHN